MIPMTDGAADLLFCLALPCISQPSEQESGSTRQQLATVRGILSKTVEILIKSRASLSHGTTTEH